MTAQSRTIAYIDLARSFGTAGWMEGLPRENAIPEGNPSALY